MIDSFAFLVAAYNCPLCQQVSKFDEVFFDRVCVFVWPPNIYTCIFRIFCAYIIFQISAIFQWEIPVVWIVFRIFWNRAISHSIILVERGFPAVCRVKASFAFLCLGIILQAYSILPCFSPYIIFKRNLLIIKERLSQRVKVISLRL